MQISINITVKIMRLSRYRYRAAFFEAFLTTLRKKRKTCFCDKKNKKQAKSKQLITEEHWWAHGLNPKTFIKPVLAKIFW